MNKMVLFSILILVFSCSKKTEETNLSIEGNSMDIYFPEINATPWETKSINNLGWNENQLSTLVNFLEEKNTKGFIILHNGKIVVEEYLNDHTAIGLVREKH